MDCARPARGAAVTMSPIVALITPHAAKFNIGYSSLKQDPSRKRWWYPNFGGRKLKTWPCLVVSSKIWRHFTKISCLGTSRWCKVQDGNSKLSGHQSGMSLRSAWYLGHLSQCSRSSSQWHSAHIGDFSMSNFACSKLVMKAPEWSAEIRALSKAVIVLQSSLVKKPSRPTSPFIVRCRTWEATYWSHASSKRSFKVLLSTILRFQQWPSWSRKKGGMSTAQPTKARHWMSREKGPGIKRPWYPSIPSLPHRQ